MAEPNVGDLVTTTLLNRQRTIADNTTKNNALLLNLQRAGRILTASGGRELLAPLSYDNNQSFKWYAGIETIDVAPYRVHDSASYQWKQAAVSVTVSGLEAEVINSGAQQVFDLVRERIVQAEQTMENGISAGCYSDGTGSNGKEIGGLQYLVSTTPSTGTVGGINAATYSWWRNGVKTDTMSATNIQSNMNDLWYQVTRGRDMPNLIVADNNYFGFYESSLQAIRRIQDDSAGDIGFRTLEYKGAPVYLDGGFGGSAPTNRMWMLNTRYLKYRPHANRNMRPLGGARYSVNQDAETTLIVFAGNLTMSNRFTQGVLYE